MKVLIVGAGIAGISSAIALTKWLPEPPQITIIEIRQQPSTMGGAIGLTPNAVRALHRLGVLEHIKDRRIGIEIDSIQLFNVYSAASLGQISFTDLNGEGVGEPRFKGLRILRSELLDALLQTAKSLPNVTLKFGCTTTAISESDSAVTISFADGTTQSADILIGADGIHSVVRSLHVEPDRKPEYTDIAGVSGFSLVPQGISLGWKGTALCQSRRGSLLCSYFEPSRAKQFLGAVMETPDVKSKEGWYAMGKEQEVLKERIKKAYLGEDIRMAGVGELVEASHDWSLWPVFVLPPRGNWCTGRVVLVGDAAHAMPPQGESAGIALEDAIVLARVVAHCTTSGSQTVSSTSTDIESAFAAYERIRRPRVDEAYSQSTWGWNTQKDSGWLSFQFRSWITWLFLAWTVKSRMIHHSEDPATKDLGLPC